jgi:hypothetical protein
MAVLTYMSSNNVQEFSSIHILKNFYLSFCFLFGLLWDLSGFSVSLPLNTTTTLCSPCSHCFYHNCQVLSLLNPQALASVSLSRATLIIIELIMIPLHTMNYQFTTFPLAGSSATFKAKDNMKALIEGLFPITTPGTKY